MDATVNRRKRRFGDAGVEDEQSGKERKTGLKAPYLPNLGLKLRTVLPPPGRAPLWLYFS